ncbi:Hypothetical protein HVR_LOCUS825 [uncultured virus]|nr:Hypothetical protein HVR_LOCUS825 [uncultured virus]
MEDTVVIDICSLVWADTIIPTMYTGPNDYYFKVDPIEYLRDLAVRGWRIILYQRVLGQEEYIEIFGEILVGDAERFIAIYENIKDRLGFARLILGPVVGTRLFSPASFLIADRDIPEYHTLTRYTPTEIFGFPDPPPIIPNGVYWIVSTDGSRYGYFAHDRTYQAIPAPTYPPIRRQIMNRTVENNQGRPVIQIFSPVYRYSNKRDRLIENRNNPSEDNVPGVQYYTYGY